MKRNLGLPIDWTNGLGVFPFSGVIILPPSNDRQWFYVQNQDVGTVTVGYGAQKSSNRQPCIALLVLGPGSSSGSQGGSEERGLDLWVVTGSITITGTAGQQIMILTGGA